jgi:hypothetical protein
MSEELVFSGEESPVSIALTPQDIVRQVARIQEVMQSVMKEGVHYGKIPGTDKPTLLQPGAQVLLLTFRLSPRFQVEMHDLGNGHREYQALCELYSLATGQLVGSGVGMCSTMESKYRYRNVADYEITGEPIPTDAKERKKEYRAQGYGMKKIDGVWEWVRYKDSERAENPDIADVYNTVLKMASKRALIHATLNTLAASDMFTQDVEDFAAIDITPTQNSAQKPVTKAVSAELEKLISEMMIIAELMGYSEKDVLKTAKNRYGVKTLQDLTIEQACEMRDGLSAKSQESILQDEEIQF